MARKPKPGKKGLPPKVLDSRALAAQPEEGTAAMDGATDGSVEAGEIQKVENWADGSQGENVSDHVKKAQELATKIDACFRNKTDQNDRIAEYWNIYNAQPDSNQQYTGNGTRYIPACRDAINARRKRTLSALFPANHKHVDAVGPTGEAPLAQLSLIEHYIRQCNLREIVSADLTAGDVTGQWNLYLDWKKSYRTIREIIKGPPIVKTADGENLEIENVIDEDEEELVEREVITEGPEIVCIATEDVAVYPPTVDRVDKATATAVRLRLTEDAIQRFIEEGVFVGVDAETLLNEMSSTTEKETVTPPKRRTSDAYIKTEGTYKYCLVYEIHTDMKLDGDRKEPVYVYTVGNEFVLGIIRNPDWSGHRPLISHPIDKLTGSFFGVSKIEPVKYLQWDLNDFWNMGMDSAQYGLLPIVMTDPAKQPQYASMTMGLAAVWLTDPNSTKFQTFPAIYEKAVGFCQAIKSQIWESMDVNEAMMGKMPAGRKNQGMVGQMQQEQQTNILDHAKNYEDNILTPLVERVMELDRQFRTESLTITTMGDVGAHAAVTDLEPQQFDITYSYRWIGTSFQMTMQRIQQGISWMNVLRGIPPQQLNGLTLDVTPIVKMGTEAIFGADMCQHILVDQRGMYTVPAKQENIILHNGMAVDVHEGDDDIEHMTEHNEAAVTSGDPHGYYRQHIADHLKALQIKRQKQMAQQQPPGQPGIPGGQMGGQPQPGVAGAPRSGAMTSVPRPQQPPGALREEQMPGGRPQG